MEVLENRQVTQNWRASSTPFGPVLDRVRWGPPDRSENRFTEAVRTTAAWGRC
jgi:hypothetical protein